MNRTTLRNFLNNAEPLTINTIMNDDVTVIECQHGNAILISEKDFLNLMNSKEDLKFISKK